MVNREIQKKIVKMRKARVKLPAQSRYNPTVAMQYYQRRVHGETEFDRYLNQKFPGRKNGGGHPKAVAASKRLEEKLKEDGIDTSRLQAHVEYVNGKRFGLWLMWREDGCSFFLQKENTLWKISCWYASRDRAHEIWQRGTISWIDWIDVEVLNS